MNQLAFIDTETTGLDPVIHQPYEAALWLEGPFSAPETFVLPHNLEHADEQALGIGRYWERGFEPGMWNRGRWEDAERLHSLLQGVTLVGSNPAFDASMLARLMGRPWHHRLINVAEGAMWLFEWDRPKGLADVVNELKSRGFVVADPDHTAVGDVIATRAVYYALRRVRAEL